MKKFIALSAALVLGLSLTLTTGDAEAARLGGGKSAGMQRQAVSPQKAAPTAAPAPSQAAAPATAGAAGAAAAAQPKRSWMGPLAGLAAGLGIAALASHFGLGGALGSMLMIGLAVMAVVLVIGFFMRKRAAAGQQGMTGANGMQYAAASPMGSDARQEPLRHEPMMKQANEGGFNTPAIGSGLAGSGAPASVSAESVERKGNIPADFDVPGFVRNAKVNFIRLQAANDAGNLDDIRDFTSPEMFAEIKLDLADRKGATQETDVITLDGEVLDVAEEASRYIVSVRFTGQLREEKGAEPTALDEVWHLTKPRDGSKGWVVAGIQQVQ